MKQDVSSQSEDFRVSVEVEASEILQQLAGVPAFGAGNVKAAIRTAAMKAGLSFSRARKLWYREARAILADEMDHLRAKANELRGRQNDALTRLEQLEGELSVLRAELSGKGLLGGSRAVDPEGRSAHSAVAASHSVEREAGAAGSRTE